MAILLTWGAVFVLSLSILDPRPGIRAFWRRWMKVSATLYDAILTRILGAVIIIMTDATALFLAAYDTILGHSGNIPPYVYIIIGLSVEFGFGIFRAMVALPGIPPVIPMQGEP